MFLYLFILHVFIITYLYVFTTIYLYVLRVISYITRLYPVRHCFSLSLKVLSLK